VSDTLIAFRTQVGMMDRTECSLPGCIATGAYQYESPTGVKAYACVVHDLNARMSANENGVLVLDVAYNQEA